MIYTRQQRLRKTAQLDHLARECGKLYSQTVVTFWRVVRKKSLWLKDKHLCRIHNNKELHAHTADATTQSFFRSLKTWYTIRKQDPSIKPPYKLKKFYRIEYKNTAIKLKDGKLRLSNGRGNEPLVLDWEYDLPRSIHINWDGRGYILNATYKSESTLKSNGDKVAAIDLGEVHMAVSYDGDNTIVLNGRYLRSVKRYQNKLKGKMDSKIDNCKRGSNRRKKLIRSKRKQTRKINNQVRDILHKQTTKLVKALHQAGVGTVVIGDMKDIRVGYNCGKVQNQRQHGSSIGKIRQYLEYKAKTLGMEVRYQNEAYTSRTCPNCDHVKKSSVRGRVYRCRKCGFEYHRDGVGAINIRRKYLGYGPVVGGMAPPIGIRYQCSSVLKDVTPRNHAA